MRDPYQILGVPKASTADEIKSAYRKLAKKLHPDVNQGRKDVETKFKEVTAAYDLLSDPAKRARFDRGEVDGQGNERGFSGDPFGGGGGYNRHSGGAGPDPFGNFGGSVEDIFAEFMSGGQRGKRGAQGAGFNAGARGADVTYSLTVPFIDAAVGSKQRVTLSGGKSIDVTIPPGTDDGHKFRLKGQGQAGASGTGDAIIEVKVENHLHFTRKANDIHLEVPISLPEAVSGATVRVPTLDGHVTLKVPPGTSSGVTLRLKGKGILSGKEQGDMFAKLKILLPEPVPDDLTELIEKWAKKNAYDPRKKLGWG